MNRRLLLATLLRTGLAQTVAYRGELVVWLLTTNTPIIMLIVWTAVAAEAPVGRYGTNEFAAYFLASLVVRLLTGAWVIWEINEEIRTGTLSMRLLKPLHPFLIYAAENIGAWPIRIVFLLPVVPLFLVWLGPSYLTRDPIQALLFVPCLLGAWGIWFSSMLCVGCLALYWHRSISVFDVWLAAYLAFSGYLVPIDLFPVWLRDWVELLPFAQILALPVNTMLGVIDRGRTITGLLLQLVYGLSFTSLALLLFRRGVRRFEAFGG
ncbi:MAG: ABC-2 family transporter protein [Deltaproteobacteria bacterium]|nr:ABC-2 family transporter protein [Deltaproteobacteria bacterium]